MGFLISGEYIYFLSTRGNLYFSQKCYDICIQIKREEKMKNFNKITIAALLIVLCTAGSAKASMISELQEEVKSLAAEISELKSQLAAAVIGSKKATTAVKTVTAGTTTKATTEIKLTSEQLVQARASGEIKPLPFGLLKKGVKGPEVFSLQQYLKMKGYLPAAVVANGHFGNETLAAVRRLQKSNIIPVTGGMTKQTADIIIKGISVDTGVTQSLITLDGTDNGDGTCTVRGVRMPAHDVPNKIWACRFWGTLNSDTGTIHILHVYNNQ